MPRPVAVVAGYVVRYPVGGMTWVFLNYLLGLRDLGFEPVFVEAAGPQPTCYDVAQQRMTEDPSYGIAYLTAALQAAGLSDMRWWYREAEPARDRGMSRDEAVAALEDCAVLLDVSGSGWAPEFDRAQRRVLIDTDAPFTQIRLADGDDDWAAFVDAHDALATYAVNVAAGRSEAPSGGREWVPTRPPIHLPSWPASEVPATGAWTTVTSWASYSSVWWQLKEYRQKDVEYMRLRDLPSRVAVPLELALGGHAPRRQLAEFGWRIVDPIERTLTPGHFEQYVRGSRAELGVAKQAYVHSRTGAFNDRSLAYLASGRPVVCSDTGLADWLPVGAGLLPFDDVHGAAAAIAEVEAEPAAHGLAARRLAEEHFAADRVLADLLASVDVSLP
ncbi:MAG TPA: hypothetical protein VNB94_01205 [Mycobacteriales bacterium]|nr:hypothetical protein [Mycobacteriales bacterium]